MRYVSTRGEAEPRDFAGVLMAGLAEDGGLFVPEAWPLIAADQWRTMRGLDYPTLAARLIAPFAAPSIDEPTLLGLARDAYAGFGHPAVAPLVQIDRNLFALELFHGPTLAFKDMAMQLLGRLFDHVLGESGARVTIVGATSGDTGSAAIAALCDRTCVDVAILHPQGRTSEVQRRQMTTVLASNISNIAVTGNFDDCQDLVKAMFADAPFRRELNLSAVNSINWARVAAQIPYYAYAALALGAPDREVAFAVPTGNFGNVLAAWAVRRMGLPVRALAIGANVNDILARFLAANDMSIRAVTPSLSPSMDIGVSSNFERLLFELLGRDAGRVRQIMTGFRTTGRMAVPDAAWREASALFSGVTLDDEAVIAAIRELHARTGYVAEPHSAIGIAAGEHLRATLPPEVAVVAAATAHPAKFPDAMERALGFRPPLPAALADLYEREERYVTADNDLGAIEALVRAHALRNAVPA
ncbi:threonine synthase [Endobacter medicaginis]|uniref:Threonine synthase n=1 Tax=Endobacter medicaginis TaxID=1181271 RepID=A0A839UVS2_9PROT|nr:threonine synthase [Endobacter medicaginis]MBB3174408.1 threonine synthase [Endobacter medicaginis]MCX5475307.1 threonine synthase [Endobacter medicaginis]NVN30576.1 threonine synthase [Endobacter medicaginis]